MKCIKCGEEIQADELFCPACLEDMALHPVKPDTPLILPNRKDQASPKRSSRRKSVKPEERISSLRRTVTVLLVAIMILLVTQTATIWMLLKMADGKEVPFLPGQNYGTSASGDTNSGK